MNATISRDTVFTVVPDRQEVVVTRVFDAPRELVFRACTDAEMVAQWWGPRDLRTVVTELEARPGGRWRFVNVADDGTEFGFHGVYHDVVPGERVVNTFEYEGVPGHVLLETVTLTEVDGGTELISRSVYQSVGDRDGMVGSGMESGVRQSHERLAELLARLRAA